MIGSGTFEWLATGPQNYRLAWHSPHGPIPMLAQIYGRENGSFAAVVVAGVKDNVPEAMGAAEWALSRLSSGKAGVVPCPGPGFFMGGGSMASARADHSARHAPRGGDTFFFP
jgi:hypothetical protein